MNTTTTTIGNWSDVNITTPIDVGLNVTSGGGSAGGGARFLPWDNPRNIISQKLSDDIAEVCECYLFPILTVAGVVGNICSLIVLMQKKLRNSTTSIILIGLAYSDALFLVTNSVRESSCIIDRFDPLLADVISATTFYYMHYLKTAFSRTSTILVVLISVERVIAVGFPLKARIWITKPKIIIAVVACYITSFAILAGYPPQYTYVYYGDKPFIAYTQFALDNADSLKVYNNYILPISLRHVPVILVFSLNTAIIVLLRRSKRFQMSSASQDAKRNDELKKVTRMLLTVAIVYLICLLPGDIFLRCAIEIPDFQFYRAYHNLFLAVSDICLLFEMFNSCINFVIYMVLNRNFYDVYVRLFCCYVPFIRDRMSTLTSRSSTSNSRKTKETSVTENPGGSAEISESRLANIAEGGHMNKGLDPIPSA